MPRRRLIERPRQNLDQVNALPRLGQLSARALADAKEGVSALGRVLESVSYQKVLERGYAVVRGPDGVISRAAEVSPGMAIAIEFADNRTAPLGANRRGPGPFAKDKIQTETPKTGPNQPARFPPMRLLLSFVLALCFPAAAIAHDIELKGEFVQGGIIFGKAPPGTKVVAKGREVRVTEDGRFVFGFGRDHGSTATLVFSYPEGGRESKQLQIAKRDYNIQRIDGLPAKQVSPPEDVWNRIKKENAMIGRVRQNNFAEAHYAGGFQWPATGVITGVYGSQRVLNGQPKRPHYGIDIAAPTGTAVVAPGAGVVTLAEDDLYYTGGTIILDHGHGLSSAFLHMEDVEVEVGQFLAKGERMGTVGATGRATGPHLDWRMNWFKERVDPAFLVGPMPASN